MNFASRYRPNPSNLTSWTNHSWDPTREIHARTSHTTGGEHHGLLHALKEAKTSMEAESDKVKAELDKTAKLGSSAGQPRESAGFMSFRSRKLAARFRVLELVLALFYSALGISK